MCFRNINKCAGYTENGETVETCRKCKLWLYNDQKKPKERHFDPWETARFVQRVAQDREPTVKKKKFSVETEHGVAPVEVKFRTASVKWIDSDKGDLHMYRGNIHRVVGVLNELRADLNTVKSDRGW